MVNKILIARPRGFCAGVERAIAIVERSLEKFGAPIYVRHHIVHNNHIVSNFEKRGVVFVESLDEVPDKCVVILSAHGSAKSVIREADLKGLRIIDAVCPLVNKVHIEAQRYSNEGYSIVVIGKRSHQEIIGTLGQMQEGADVVVVEKIEDVENVVLRDSKNCVYLTQTTLSIDETKDIIEKLKSRFPHILAPPKEDICYATTNRQNAIKKIAKECDLILIVGSATSSNSNKLQHVAHELGCEAYLIDDYTSIDENWFEGKNCVSVSSGASVPEYLVEEVLNYLKDKFSNADQKEIVDVEENMKFLLPVELR